MKINQNFSINYTYDILFTRELFAPSNPLLNDVITKNGSDKAIKIAFVIDKGLNDCQPELISKIENYVSKQEKINMACPPLIVIGGEETKNSTEEFVKVLSIVNDAKIDRHAFVVAIGGGAVLDMVGFASAIAHRGIRHIRIPTTVLSQNDSGVGVKNGINYFGKKNFLGNFAPPFAVINDLTFLTTLDERDWRSGMSEAIKVALIKNQEFFLWLEKNAIALSNRDLDAMEKLVFDCAQLHTDHISNSNDPFEMGSSRPLDFGHWAAHKLEQLTKFEVKHGEAVAIGIALDIAYAMHAGFLDTPTTDRILKLLSDLGFSLFHPLLLDPTGTKVNPELIKGLEEFREHLGGELTITMVEKIGEKFDVHEMNSEWIEKAVFTLVEKKEMYAY
ncbi:3-dehydroquinate synthase [Reichenbachiella sp. MALMAid0571]|uniref:3-dehydroquinate synthase n=1 Tax=Reichenbachiella sp. MALMAid0571 TaxID=3143939 RepID=UPI0032DE6864